jgi:hypothetical protein
MPPASSPTSTTPTPTMTFEGYFLKAQLMQTAAAMAQICLEGQVAPADPSLGANATNPNATPAQVQASQAFLAFQTAARDNQAKWYEYLAQAIIDETVFPHAQLQLAIAPGGGGAGLSPASILAALSTLAPAQLQPFAAALAPLLQVAGQVAAGITPPPAIPLGAAAAGS